jgi:hypothetical protein
MRLATTPPRFSGFRVVPVFAAALATAAIAGVGNAGAASGVFASGAPGAVIEDVRPVNCTNMWSLVGNVGRTVTVVGPRVYARALNNGSTQQYVNYRADIIDLETGAKTQGTTEWFLASTTNAVVLPRMVGHVPLGHRVVVDMIVLWWDPVSQGYTGALSYRVNAYFNSDYSPAYFRSTYC